MQDDDGYFGERVAAGFGSGIGNRHANRARMRRRIRPLEEHPLAARVDAGFLARTDRPGALTSVAADGVRERFLRHFSSDELLQLGEMWNRVLPGAAATPE